MSLATLDDLASGMASVQRIPFSRVHPNIASTNTKFFSSWLSTSPFGGLSRAGLAPPAYTAGSGYACDKDTVGALPYINASYQNWLVGLSAYGNTSSGITASSLHLVDRLWACSGIGPGIATYTITTPGSLPARITDDGDGCELWFETYATTGAGSAPVVTANYLDNTGASKSSVLSPAWSLNTPAIGSALPFSLLGIKQLTSIAISANAFSSGTFGVTIVRRLAQISLRPPASIVSTGPFSGYANWAKVLCPIPQNACLSFYSDALSQSVAPVTVGALCIIDK